MEHKVVMKESITYAGVGDLKESYNHGIDWLMEELFDFSEDFYKEKVKGDSKEIEIKWTAIKKVTDYFRIRLDIKWRVSGMTDVEVEIDGKKKRMNKFAALKIDIKGTLEKDYESKWSGSGMQNFFKNIYDKYIIHGTTEQKESEVVETVQSFKNEMKAFFDLLCKKDS